MLTIADIKDDRLRAAASSSTALRTLSAEELNDMVEKFNEVSEEGLERLVEALQNEQVTMQPTDEASLAVKIKQGIKTLKRLEKEFTSSNNKIMEKDEKAHDEAKIKDLLDQLNKL